MKDFVGRTALPELTMQRVILHLFFVICLPDFVTKVDFDWAIEEKAKKKKQDFTKIKFFTYDKGEFLTIKPQDIGLLPRENWNYGNNSFLLHGYYNYRYLILARIGDETKGRTRYILGVPGNYYSNEKYMASMFGFPHFVLARKQPSQDGRFGYWYTDVRLENQD